MTNKVVSSVIDDINEWERTPGSFIYYVTAIFTDESVGSVGRKDHDAALEVQGLLREAIGQELDFTLEPKGQTKTGRDKFTIKGFGTPGGAATYTAPGVQGGGVVSTGPDGGGRIQASPSRGRSPEHDQFIQERMDRRTALMQAVEWGGYPKDARAVDHMLHTAAEFYDWLRVTSEPASSAYPEGGGMDAALPVGSPEVQAGVGSESSQETRPLPADSGEGQGGEGEAHPCPPHDLDLDVAPKAMRYPCRRCGSWVKPTMAAEEAEDART